MKWHLRTDVEKDAYKDGFADAIIVNGIIMAICLLIEHFL